MEPLEARLAIAGIVVAVLAIGFLIFLAIGMVRDFWGTRGRGGNARVRTARKRRQRLERRADAEAQLTGEVLASADTLVDEVADMRQRLAGQTRMNQRQLERDQLASQLAGGIPAAAAGGGPPAPPARPPGI